MARRDWATKARAILESSTFPGERAAAQAILDSLPEVEAVEDPPPKRSTRPGSSYKLVPAGAGEWVWKWVSDTPSWRKNKAAG